MTTPEQLDFPSLAFPEDRRTLTVGEVALRWNVSDQHVIDLLEEGALDGFNIAGRHEYVRVPRAWLEGVARRLRVTPEALLAEAAAARPGVRSTRAHWRIPVEGYEGFIRENHSRNPVGSLTARH